MSEQALPEEVRERVRSYLVAQAERKTFSELRPAVEEARTQLYGEVDGLSETQAEFQPPGDGEAAWSIKDVLRHCVHEEEGVALRIRALGLGDPARGPSLGRVVGRKDGTLADLIRDLKAANFALEHAVGSVEGKERLDTTAPHPWFGELNCRAWYLFQRVHDGDHTRQIQQIKAHPGFPRP
jgi:hypothetical protein